MNGQIERQPESVTHMKRRTVMRKTVVLGSMSLGLLMLASYALADQGENMALEGRTAKRLT